MKILGSVLVVEDEPLIRMLAVDMIQDSGFTVLEAANVAEALEILKSDPGVGCVFTDINMPGELDGLDLADIIRHRWPQISVLLTTGNHRLVSAEMRHSHNFLPKPYNFDDVHRALEACA